MPPAFSDDNTPVINGSSNLNASLLPICTLLAARVKRLLQTEASTPLLKQVQEQIRVALGVIDEALDRYRFVSLLSGVWSKEVGSGIIIETTSTNLRLHSVEEISLSYNGGKDCLVLLILFLVSLSTHPKCAASLPAKLQSVYFISPDPFAEVDSFVSDSVTTYSLNLARYAIPMKEALKLYLEEHKNVKAILVGTRRTDPHGQLLTHFDPTDKGWPPFTRVHPIIDWHYAEIWAVGCPFCAEIRTGD